MPRFVDPGHIPGPVFIPNCASIRIIWTLQNGKQASNVLHASFATPPARDQTTVNNVFTLISTAFTASSHDDSISSGVTLTRVGLRDMSPTTPPGGYGELLSNLGAVSGSGTGDVLPANVALVVTLKSDRRGQAGRGRVYLPGFTEATNQANGTCDINAANAAVDFIGRIDAGLGGMGLQLGIAHPARAAYTGSTGVEHPARAPGIVDVVNINCENLVWDSQRLRQI